MITIYSKEGCQYCAMAKEVMRAKGVSYDEVVIGESSNDDMKREEFMRLFPMVKSLPYLLQDGKPIGGYGDLIDHLNKPMEN